MQDRFGNPPPSPPPPKADTVWLMACHLSSFATFFFPFGNILGPLIVWLSRRDVEPEADQHGRASLNFQITMTLAGFGLGLIGVVAFVVGLVGFGISLGSTSGSGGSAAPILGSLGALALIAGFAFLFVILAIYSCVLTIVNAVRASSNQPASYPLSIEFLKAKNPVQRM